MHLRIHLIILLAFLFCSGCGPDDLNNPAKRNGHWDWWVDSTGIGRWIPVSHQPTWKNGRYIQFYFDGKIGEKGTIKGGNYVDTTFWFDRKGQIYGYKVEKGDSSFEYYTRDGPIKIYRFNGKLRMEGIITNHQIGDQWTDYYPNGQIERVFDLHHDTGWLVHNFETGQIKDSQFVMNDQAFVVAEWNEEGIQTVSSGWKDLHFEGESLKYYENGNLWVRTQSSHGKLNGDLTVYFLSGKIQKSFHYQDSLQDGRQLEYYENGQVQSDLFYKKGQMDGPQNYYDEKGNVKVTAIYNHGIKIK
jgi:antitoxin component YwqK of YwqJK toxin-antitoxin module